MNTAFISYLKGLKRSENTIKAYTKDIGELLSFTGKSDIETTQEDLLNWKADISDKGMSTATIGRKVSSIRVYFEFLEQFEYIQKSPAKYIKAPKVKNKVKVPLEPNEVRDMVNATTNSRDRAILLLMASTGVRVSELLDIKLNQFTENNSRIVITGKGDKERVIYLNEEVACAINTYLEVRPTGEDNLFLSFGGKRIYPENLSRTLKVIAKKAGVSNWDRVCNHLLRTTFATIKSEQNVPLNIIQQSLGHSSISTTMTYIKNKQSAIEEAMMASSF